MTETRATPLNNPVARFRKNPTRPNAIKAMCANCMGCTDEEINPGFRSLIRDCTSPKCPLYAFRPYQEKAPAGDA